MRRLLVGAAVALAVLVACLGLGGTALPVALAAPQAAGQPFLCDGEPLLVERQSGAVDAVGIPNTLAGTLPGAYVVVRWRGVQLQLPRTNNAGAPTYSDGKWAWSEPEPGHAELRLCSPGGDLRRYRCEAEPSSP